MKQYLAAVALIAALAQSASATTFPTLTTIYVGSGVYDDDGSPGTGIATSIHCSNVSGVSVQVRVLILNSTGAAAGSLTKTLAHGETVTFSTHQTIIFQDTASALTTGIVDQGVVKR